MGAGRLGKIILRAFPLFAAAFVLLTACAKTVEEPVRERQGAPVVVLPVEAETDTAEAAGEENASGGRLLIAYFSRHGVSYGSDDTDVDAVSSASLMVGNAEVVAGMIEEMTGGELFQIKTVMTYPKDYEETHNVARRQLTADERPELSERVDGMEQYDTILLCYPNWWGTLPMPVYTFLEEYDFSGKTIVPFCVSGGGGFGKSLNDLRTALPDAEVKDGLYFREGGVENAESAIRQCLVDSAVIAE